MSILFLPLVNSSLWNFMFSHSHLYVVVLSIWIEFMFTVLLETVDESRTIGFRRLPHEILDNLTLDSWVILSVKLHQQWVLHKLIKHLIPCDSFQKATAITFLIVEIELLFVWLHSLWMRLSINEITIALIRFIK